MVTISASASSQHGESNDDATWQPIAKATLRVVSINAGRSGARVAKLDTLLDVVGEMWPSWDTAYIAEVDGHFCI